MTLLSAVGTCHQGVIIPCTLARHGDLATCIGLREQPLIPREYSAKPDCQRDPDTISVGVDSLERERAGKTEYKRKRRRTAQGLELLIDRGLKILTLRGLAILIDQGSVS